MFPRPVLVGVLVAKALLLFVVVVVAQGASIARLVDMVVEFGAVGGSGVAIDCYKSSGLALVAIGVEGNWYLMVRGRVGMS